MNEEQIIRRLAAAAVEPAPMVDVADAVVRDLAVQRPRRVDPILGWFAAASALAAMIITGVAASVWVQWQDPLAELFQTMAVIP